MCAGENSGTGEHERGDNNTSDTYDQKSAGRTDTTDAGAEVAAPDCHPRVWRSAPRSA